MLALSTVSLWDGGAMKRTPWTAGSGLIRNQFSEFSEFQHFSHVVGGKKNLKQ